MQRQQLATAAATDSTVASKYRAGFSECANEVSRYLGTVDGLVPEVRDRLLHHLFGCMTRGGSSPAPTGMVHPQIHPQQSHHQQNLGGTTHPIHIQIPVATPVSSLPGAPQQNLVANTTQAQIAHGSPVSPQGACYVGAFQVLPASPEMALVIPSTQTLVSTPMYMVQQQLSSASSTITSDRSSPVRSSPVRSSPVQTPSPEPVHPVCKVSVRNTVSYERAPSRNTAYNCHQMAGSFNMNMKRQVALRDALHEEKVWRPW